MKGRLSDKRGDCLRAGFTYANCGCCLRMISGWVYLCRLWMPSNEGDIIRVYICQLWMLSDDDFGLGLSTLIVDAVWWWFRAGFIYVDCGCRLVKGRLSTNCGCCLMKGRLSEVYLRRLWMLSDEGEIVSGKGRLSYNDDFGITQCVNRSCWVCLISVV